MPDDMPQVEQYALTDLRDMARSNLLLAWPVIGHPFMGPLAPANARILSGCAERSFLGTPWDYVGN